MATFLSIALNPTIDISSEAEKIAPVQKIRTHNEKFYPGGGGINVARVIAMLGGSVELLFLAGGAMGPILEEYLDRTDIECCKVNIQQSTRFAYMVYEQQTGLEYRFVTQGPSVSHKELDKVLGHVNKFAGDYIVLSGSLPQGAPTNTYALIADIANRNNIPCIVDCSGESLQCVLATGNIFLIKPNLRELEELVGRSLDQQSAQEAALDLVRNGAAQNIVVSMGAAGAFLANHEGGLFIPAEPIAVQSAVGAGDSFVGAMAYSLAAGNSVENAFRFGVAAGGAAVMTPGTELCKPEDVLTLYKAILNDDRQDNVLS
ncbi:MAG: 1-phosphofructokinase family hexose kinase [Oceanospirillaceae bacterium]